MSNVKIDVKCENRLFVAAQLPHSPPGGVQLYHSHQLTEAAPPGPAAWWRWQRCATLGDFGTFQT
jgi:hypothetical protein